MQLLRSSYVLIIFLISFNALALVSKKTETAVEVQSDTASFEQLTRQATHTGNVVMKQGDHLLTADKLVIQKDIKGGLSEITATGNPATFKGQLGSKEPLQASAKVIHYYPGKQLIVLEGEATIVHQQDKFHGPTLSYQIDKQIVSATKQESQRPTIIFYPQV